MPDEFDEKNDGSPPILVHRDPARRIADSINVRIAIIGLIAVAILVVAAVAILALNKQPLGLHKERTLMPPNGLAEGLA